LRLFNRCAEELAGLGVKPRLGKYGASMRVALENDGPVTLILDSRKP
jgi:D-tyrosyl-tRNA(Tyr) deacylase